MKSNCFFRSETLKFRQFSRKGYALFVCLGRMVVIGVLSVATLQNANAAGIGAEGCHEENDSIIPRDREYDLSEVEVSGTRAPLSAGQSMRMVTVLQRQDIEAAAARSVNDLLKLCTGVDVRQRAPLGAQTDISIRGGTSEHIAILLNGICISDPQTGHNTLDLPIQLSEIERIEVLEGPAAKAVGAQSLLGAINIITKYSTLHTPHSTLTIEGGSFGYLNASAVVPLPFSNSISASYARSDGFSRAKDGSLNNDYEANKLYYQGSLNTQHSTLHTLQWSFGLAKKRWGSSTSYGLGSDSQYERTDKYFANVCSELNFSKYFSLKPALYWQQNNDRYQWRRGISVPNRNTTDIYGANLNAFVNWPQTDYLQNRTTAGVELRNEDLRSSNMPNTNRTNLSLQFEHNIVFQRFSLSAGFLAIKNSFNDMPMKLYPGVDAALRIASRWKWYASWNRSMRLPTFTDLYYKVDGHLADPHLQPEEMEAVETGVKHLSRYGQSSLSIYRHQGRNMIDWILDTRQGTDAVWTSVNHTEINSYGVEFQNRWHLSQLFPSQKILKTFTFGYNYIHQTQDKEEHIQSLYALEYLRHKVVAGLTACLYSEHLHADKQDKATPRNLNLSLNYRFHDRIGEYTDAEGTKKNYQPYSVVDARLDWTARHYTAFLTVNNLFSNHFVDYGNIKQPGAWLIAGIAIRYL